ncbi:MAG: FHA domain-containing protein [Salinivirgaceae bacterium]|nr:FHA domain-containing protein [Salinivirgaceae bacterium]
MAEFKQTVSGTVGSGMKSLFGGNGRTFYELQHKVSSAYHKAGESQKIIVDQIKLGRDAKCQVRFDESFSTVSREHAAIVRDGDNWKLIQLSKTNPTYLNGRQVTNEWYLQSGDEIQLATNGPKLGFVVPTGKGSLIKSIGLTQRLPMFVNQALKPYKTAITALVCVLVLLVCGSVWLAINSQNKIDDLTDQLGIFATQNEEQKQAMERAQQKIEQQQKKLKQQQDSIARIAASQPKAPSTAVSAEIVNKAIESCVPNVFYIQSTKTIISYGGIQEEIEFGISGTGFLLADGRFVTARHVVEPWMYPENDDTELKLNLIASNGGMIEHEFVAISSTGKRFVFKSTQFNYKRDGDVIETNEDINIFATNFFKQNGEYKLIHASRNPSDVAWTKVNDNSGLKANASLSTKLQRNTELRVLGFPYGLGANSPTDITPISSSATTAVAGLQHGRILLSNASIDHGNSGGPAFVLNSKGEMEVIGVVSSGVGQTLIFIVPISEIY